jgi:hypothetical protein
VGAPEGWEPRARAIPRKIGLELGSRNEEEGEVISPGTANTSRPSSSAKSAVIKAPERSRASTTTVARQSPAMILFLAGKPLTQPCEFAAPVRRPRPHGDHTATVAHADETRGPLSQRRAGNVAVPALKRSSSSTFTRAPGRSAARTLA